MISMEYIIPSLQNVAVINMDNRDMMEECLAHVIEL